MVYESGIVVVTNEDNKLKRTFSVDYWWCESEESAKGAFMSQLRKQQHERQGP